MPRTPYWRDSLKDINIASGNQSLTSLLGDWTSIETRGLTLVRLIVSLDVTPQTLGGTNSDQVMTYGVGVVGQDAFAASAVPDTEVEADRPPRGWLVRGSCRIIDSVTEPLPAVLCVGDFRGKRKLDNGELVLIMHNAAHSGTAFAISVTGVVRALFLLP